MECSDNDPQNYSFVQDLVLLRGQQLEFHVLLVPIKGFLIIKLHQNNISTISQDFNDITLYINTKKRFFDLK